MRPAENGDCCSRLSEMRQVKQADRQNKIQEPQSQGFDLHPERAKSLMIRSAFG